MKVAKKVSLKIIRKNYRDDEYQLGYCDHLAIYTNSESSCTPENTMLYVIYISKNCNN